MPNKLRTTLLSFPILSLFGISCSPPPKYNFEKCKDGSSATSCGAESDDQNANPTPAPNPNPYPGTPSPTPAGPPSGPLTPSPNPSGPLPSNPLPANPAGPQPSPTPTPAPPVSTGDGKAEVTTPACANGQAWTFADYPSKWDISKTGRIKDAMPNESVVQDAEKGAVLQVQYGKGTSSPSASRTRGLVPGGTQFIPTMKNTYPHAVLSYWLKIPQDFDCVKGGKLPGIASNIELLSGGETADGTNGFSMRLMWRENCSAEVYGYLPREANQHLITKYKDSLTQNPTTKIIYGWSIGRGEFSLPKGSWTKVDLSVRVNDVGKQNGYVKIALNGKQVFERNEIVYRTNDQLKVGALFFSTFFGGSDESFAASKNEHLLFGDMAICPVL